MTELKQDMPDVDARNVLGDNTLFEEYNEWLGIETVYDVINNEDTIRSEESPAIADEILKRSYEVLEDTDNHETVSHLI